MSFLPNWHSFSMPGDASLVDLLRVGAELTGSYAALLRTPKKRKALMFLGFRKGELVTTLARLRAYVKRASP